MTSCGLLATVTVRSAELTEGGALKHGEACSGAPNYGPGTAPRGLTIAPRHDDMTEASPPPRELYLYCNHHWSAIPSSHVPIYLQSDVVGRPGILRSGATVQRCNGAMVQWCKIGTAPCRLCIRSTGSGSPTCSRPHNLRPFRHPPKSPYASQYTREPSKRHHHGQLCQRMCLVCASEIRIRLTSTPEKVGRPNPTPPRLSSRLADHPQPADPYPVVLRDQGLLQPP